MKVFISYRRKDSPYLAKQVRDVLANRVGDDNVFFDVADISPGMDFMGSIRREIGRADVLLVLIGPNWAAERLGEPRDPVYAELMAARELDRRVVPVLHSEQQLPRPDDLPDELAWLAFRNAFVIGSPMTYEDDLSHLADLLEAGVPRLSDLRARVWSLYEQRQHEAVIEAVEEAWVEHGHAASPGLAELCRIAAISSTRAGQDIERALWWARTLSTAHISGASNVMVGSLLPYFFQLTEAGEGSKAREVLAECRKLLIDQAGTIPPRSLMLRLYHEKLGYSLYADGEYARALIEYEDAAMHAALDERGRLKIRGARALCHFRLGEVILAVRETEVVLSESSGAEFLDVRDCALANLAAMRGEGRILVPYEIL